MWYIFVVEFFLFDGGSAPSGAEAENLYRLTLFFTYHTDAFAPNLCGGDLLNKDSLLELVPPEAQAHPLERGRGLVHLILHLLALLLLGVQCFYGGQWGFQVLTRQSVLC